MTLRVLRHFFAMICDKVFEITNAVIYTDVSTNY